MRIAVLGGKGFIGSSVVSSGSENGLDIAAVETVRVSAWANGSLRSSLRAWHESNRAAFERQCAALEGFDVVINAVGITESD